MLNRRIARAHAAAVLLLLGACAFLGAVCTLLLAPALLPLAPLLLITRRPAGQALSQRYARRRKAAQYRALQREVRRAH